MRPLDTAYMWDLVPIILGFVLGRLLEDNLRRALSLSDGDPMVLLASPVSIGLWVMTVLAVLWPLLPGLRRGPAPSA